MIGFVSLGSHNPGTGKTVFMKYLASLCEPRIFIVDPLNQYTTFPDNLRYVPKQETPMELEAICQKLWKVSNLTLIVEEAEQYIAQGKSLLPYTSGLIRMGRNWGIGIYATTRRIQDINKRFFDLAQHCFFFRCGLKSRDYISYMLGYEYMYPAAHPVYNKTGYTITTLPPFHCLHFNLEDETAQVLTLKLRSTLSPGQGGHLDEVSKKAESPVKKGTTEEPEEEETNE